jgi:hypothetical protein
MAKHVGRNEGGEHGQHDDDNEDFEEREAAPRGGPAVTAMGSAHEAKIAWAHSGG